MARKIKKKKIPTPNKQSNRYTQNNNLLITCTCIYIHIVKKFLAYIDDQMHLLVPYFIEHIHRQFHLFTVAKIYTITSFQSFI